MTLEIPESISYGNMTYTVAVIGPRAFLGCDADVVVLPASVASIDDLAFRGSAVAAVEVADGNSTYSSHDGMLFDADRTSLLLIPEGKQGAALIPQTAESVPPGAFSHCASVTSVSVDEGSADLSSWNGLLYDASGETLLRVPAGAEQIEIPDGCTTVAAGALEGCAKLRSIHAPASVAEVDPDVLGASAGGAAALPADSLAWREAGSPDASGDSVVRSAPGGADSSAANSADKGPGSDGAGGASGRRPTGSDGPTALPGASDGAVAEAGPAEGADAPAQLNSLAALSAESDGLALVDSASVTAYLVLGADPAPWEAVGFAIEAAEGDSSGDAAPKASSESLPGEPLGVLASDDSHGLGPGDSDNSVDGPVVVDEVTVDYGYANERSSANGAYERALPKVVATLRLHPLLAEGLAGEPLPEESQATASFLYEGCLYVIDPEGGAALVAVDPKRLAECVEDPTTLILPDYVDDGTWSYPLTRIGKGALRGSGIERLRIPASATYLDYALEGCETLRYVEIAEDSPVYSSKNGCLYDKAGETLWMEPEGSDVTRINLALDAGILAATPTMQTSIANRDPGDKLSLTVYMRGTHGVLTAATRQGKCKADHTADTWSKWWSKTFATESYNNYMYIKGGHVAWRSGGDGAEAKSGIALPAGVNNEDELTGLTSSTSPCGPAVSMIGRGSGSWDGGYWVAYTRCNSTSTAFVVEFDANGGTGGQAAAVKATYNAEMPTISSISPTRTGYKFMGWYDTAEASGGTQYYSELGASTHIWDKSTGGTLYARWAPIVSFDKNGGTGGTSTKSVSHGSTVGTVTKPTLSGWTFSGYTDDLGTSTYLFVKADGTATTRTITGPKTLKANWTKTVTLNGNGATTAGSLKSITAGIGRPLGQKCTQVTSSDADYPIRSLFSVGITDKSDWAPTRTGYTFAGYYDTSASTGGTCWITKDGVGKTVASAIPSTLYARWTPNTYTCTFDKKGGTGGSDTATATFKAVLPTVTKPALSGWTFRGYTDTLGVMSYLYVKDSGAPTTRTWGYAADKTLYANWTKTVTLNGNGATTAGSLKSITAGIGRPLGQKCAQVDSSHSDYPIRSLFSVGIADKSDWAPTRTGYAFAGYYDTSASTGGTCWIDKDGVGKTVASAIPGTLYARWTPNTYTVSFSVNGGGGSGYQAADKTATYGSAMPAISATKPMRTGYAFMGWYDDSNYAASGAKQYYTDACKSARAWDKTSNTTLYAGWKAIPYSISYDAAGGELPEGARGAYTIEDAFDLPAPTRYGYQFEGWKVAGAEGSGIEDATAEDGSKVTRVKAGTYGDLSCTARWTLRYDLDVPVADPGEVTFEADSLTGQVRVRPGTSAEGAIMSYMAVPVALDSLACEGLGADGQPDAAGGAPELEAIFGAGSASQVLFTATVGEGDAPHVARLTAGGASGTASLAGLSVPAATSHDAPGRIAVSYGLELDPGLAIPPVRDAAPVARLTWTVSLPAAGA